MHMHVTVIAVHERIEVAVSNPSALVVPADVEGLLLLIRPREIRHEPLEPGGPLRQLLRVDPHAPQEGLVGAEKVIEHALEIGGAGEGRDL